MNKFTIASGAVFLAAFSFVGAAHADGSGYYVGLSGTVNKLADVDANNGHGGGGEVKTTASFDPGYGVALRGGKKFGSFRAELELAYKAVDVDDISTASGSVTNPKGDASIYTGMVNGYYDIEMDAAVTPYVMAGVGALYAEAGGSYTADSNANRTESFGDEGTTVAGQIGLGVSYGITDQVDLVGGYALMGAPTGKTGEEEILMIHTAQVGLNYNF